MTSISKIEPSSFACEDFVFAGVECMRCYSEDDAITTEYFLAKPTPESDEDYIELERIVKKHCGRDRFSQMSCRLGTVIRLSRCQNCGSEDVFEEV